MDCGQGLEREDRERAGYPPPETVTFTTTDNFDFTGGGDAGRISVTPGCDPILPRDERFHQRWLTPPASSGRRAAVTRAIQAAFTTSVRARTRGT
jgi:hypothetical protein